MKTNISKVFNNMPSDLRDQLKELIDITDSNKMDGYINKYTNVSFEECAPFFAKFILTINDMARALLDGDNDRAETIINEYYTNVLEDKIDVCKDGIRIGEFYEMSEFEKFMHNLIRLSECGGIRSYFDIEARKYFPYSDSFIIFNFFSVIEELTNDFTGEIIRTRNEFENVEADMHTYDYIKTSAKSHFWVIEQMANA